MEPAVFICRSDSSTLTVASSPEECKPTLLGPTEVRPVMRIHITDSSMTGKNSRQGVLGTRETVLPILHDVKCLFTKRTTFAHKPNDPLEISTPARKQ